MPCIVLNKVNKQPSIAFNALYEYYNDEAKAKEIYASFESESFIKEFGDWVSDLNIKELADKSITDQRRVDDNGEPAIFKEDNSLYYKDKYNNRVYLTEKQSLKDLYTADSINKITNILTFNFIKGRVNTNFNELDISAQAGTLKESILDKLNSKIAQLESSSDFNQNMEAEVMKESLGSINQWVKNVEDKFKEMKLIYKEETEGEEITEEETTERGELMRKSSFEKNSKDNITANIKLRLSLLTNNELDNLFYEPTFVPFDEVYSTLQGVLTNNVALENEDLFNIYKQEVFKLSVKKPYLKNLYSQLASDTLSDNVKAEFVQAFNLDRNNFIGTTYSITAKIQEDGSTLYSTDIIVQNLSDVGGKETFIKSNWTYNLIKKISNRGEFNTKSIEKVIEINKEFVKVNSEFKANKDLTKSINELNNIFNKLGIVTTEKGFNHYLDGLDSLDISETERITNFNKLLNSTNYFLTRVIDRSVDLSNDPFNDQGEFNKLAKAEAFFMSEGSDSSIFSVGKSKWVYSYPSYLSSKLKVWRKDRNQLLNHYQSTPYNQGSYYMKYLLALDGDYANVEEVSKERLEQFELNVFNSLQEKNDSSNASDNKTLSKNDAFADVFNKVLGFRKNTKSYFNTPTPADKATQYQFSAPTSMMLNTNTRYINGSIDFNSNAKNVIFDYIKSEFERIKLVKQEIEVKDEKELIVHYHTGAQNGLKFQLFPSLNFENFDNVKSGFSLYDTNGNPLNIELDTVKEQILELITKEVGAGIMDTYTKIRDLGMIEITEEGGFINKGFDSNIWDSYQGNKQTGIKVAGDIYVNTLISQVEYSKMFSGDVAYYKNMVDYKKRIPATYTDGLQLYLRPGEEYYNVSVIEGVNIQTPYYEELKKLVGKEIADNYTNVNSTDAQAWITPPRWKFLKEKLGKWSSADDIVYSKILGENNEPFTVEELKRTAQPLKGVYFEINNGVPTYLKYSQAVLVPAIIKNNKGLRKLSKSMEEQGIDELITIDGVKVGANLPVQTHNEQGLVKDNLTLNKLQLKNSGWKLQQDLPVKTFKSTDVGSQIQKNIFSGLANNLEETFNIEDKELSGAELISHINDIVNKLSNKGLERLKSEFKISDDFKIGRPEKLNESLIEELKSRGASKNVINALENNITSYGIPGYQQKIQNAFASIVRDRVVKIKTNGGSFIQMSNYGFNKNEADNKGVVWTPWAKDTTHEYELLENGKIRPAGILLTGSFISKYIPDYKSKSKAELFGTEENNYEDGLIDKKILENIIGYRIPNQGLASNDALEIVGILPEEMGDTVVAYTGITTKTGSDFDIDKMYLMMPNYTGDSFGLNYINSEGDSTKALQNALIEAYKAVILNPNTIKDVMTPIDFDFIENDIKNLFPEVESKDLSDFNILSEVDLKYEFIAGKAGVGIEANAVVDHVRGLMANLTFNDYYLGIGNKQGNETKFDEEFSQELSPADIKYYEKATGSKGLKKIKIANSLSALLNAYVDIAKDPYITRGNWTTQTANTGNMLIRAGVHPYYVNAILGQPIIKEYVDFVTNSESIVVKNSGDLQNKFINELIKQDLGDQEITINGITKRKSLILDATPSANIIAISKIFGISPKNKDIISLQTELTTLIESFKENDYENIGTYSLKRLRDQISGQVNPQDQLNVLRTFFEWQEQSKQLVKNINASKMDVTGYGKNITSLITIENLINSLNGISKSSIKGFDTKLFTNGQSSILGTYKENSIDFTKKVMKANPLQFLVANQSVINTFNEISKSIYNEPLINDRLADKLEKSYYSYVISDFTPIKTTEEQKKELIENIPDRVMEAKKNSDNIFLRELDLKIGDNKRNYITISNRKKSVDIQTEITNGWLDLLEEDYELGMDLIKYSFLTSGFQNNINQFYTYIPFEIFAENDINGFIKQISIDLAKDTTIDKGFINSFFRQNMNDNQIVPLIFNSEIDNNFNLGAGFITEERNDRLFVKKDNIIKDKNGADQIQVDIYQLKGYTADNKSVYIKTSKLGNVDRKGNKIFEVDRGKEISGTILKENMIKKSQQQVDILTDQILKNTDGTPAKLPNDNSTNLDDTISVNNDTFENDQIVTTKNLLELDKPSIKANYLTDNEILDSEDAIKLKVEQDSLKKEVEDLNNLINCLWS